MMLMRTTLTIDDDVMKRAREKAAEDERPLKDVINDALRFGLEAERASRKPYRFRLRTVQGKTLPGVDLTDRDKLFDLMEGR